jgi:putative transposase
LTVPIRASNYHRGKLTGQKPTSAQVSQHKDGDWYVHIQLKSEPPKLINSKNVIGVDFGRRDIAVTNTGKSWSGKEIQSTRNKYSRVGASLQKKASQGTRSTRRRARQILKRLSGRERRYQAWLNHNISKAIIAEAKKTQSFVSIEDLTGIREVRSLARNQALQGLGGLAARINLDNLIVMWVIVSNLKSSSPTPQMQR